MSVYNGEQYLSQAIDSILAQTYRNFEFVIYDDCSTDGTSSIIKQYSDPRIIYRRNSSNMGLTWNLHDGVSRSRGQFIVRIDADDIAYPNRLEKQLRWMVKHPDITIVGTPVNYFKENPGDGSVALQPSDNDTIKAKLLISFTLMHPSIMIRKEDLEKNNINYNIDFRYSQDHALYLDCIRYGLKFANMAEPLLYMRFHSSSISCHNHFEQQKCSKAARKKFIDDTGIADTCSEQEICVYNNLASGEYPKGPSEVHTYEHFVTKICNNPITSEYFDIKILRSCLASALCDKSYFAISDKLLRKSAITARKSFLTKFSSHWSLKMKVKFLIKKLMSL